MDSITSLFREKKYAICFDIKRKKLHWDPSKKSGMNAKGPPV